MELGVFEKKALEQFTREITDIFFSYIQNDKELMQEYLRTVGRDSDLDTVNKRLGMAVKKWFDLDDFEAQNHSPKSVLIRSYTEHIKR